MARFKVVLEKEECTACESCVESSPATFEMADGLAHLKGATPGSREELEVDELGANKDAAEACPVNIIHIFEGGSQII